jgi:hypothetical protein
LRTGRPPSAAGGGQPTALTAVRSTCGDQHLDLGQRLTSDSIRRRRPLPRPRQVGLRPPLPTVEVDFRRNRCTRSSRTATALALGWRDKSSASGPRWRRLQVGGPFSRLTEGWAVARRLEDGSGGLPDAGGRRPRGRCRLRVTVRRTRSPTLSMLFSASPGEPVGDASARHPVYVPRQGDGGGARHVATVAPKTSPDCSQFGGGIRMKSGTQIGTNWTQSSSLPRQTTL